MEGDEDGGSITSGAIAQWTATSAWVEGNPIDEHNFKVRFGYDNAKDKCVIVIGNNCSIINNNDNRC